MRKNCPIHGESKALVWSDAAAYSRSFRFRRPGKQHLIKRHATQTAMGCPYDCGLCPDHLQHTCLAILEITNRCNLRCPVCYAAANEGPLTEPSLHRIKNMLNLLLESETSPPTLQLTGGEPTLRTDLIPIVESARDLGFDDITLASNGLTLAQDPTLAHRLAKAGVTEVSISFDGVDDAVYQAMRGRPLLSAKNSAISNAKEAGISVTLGVTVVRGINDHQLGEIVDFAKRKRVDGLNFAPIAFVGRYPEEVASPIDRVTLPEVLSALENQTEGELSRSDFLPVPCPDNRCSAMTYALNTQEGLLPMNHFFDVEPYFDTYGESGTDSEMIDSALERLYSLSAVPGSKRVLRSLTDCCSVPHLGRSDCMTISVHGFMDRFTFDVQRAKKCCIHVVKPDGKLIPFCVFNVLHRGKGQPPC